MAHSRELSLLSPLLLVTQLPTGREVQITEGITQAPCERGVPSTGSCSLHALELCTSLSALRRSKSG